MIRSKEERSSVPRSTNWEKQIIDVPPMTRRTFGTLLAAAGSLRFGNAAALKRREHLAMDGSWEFCTDPEDAGLKDLWYAPGKHFSGSITVPGAWQAQGIGKPSGSLRHQYQGVAWYRRRVRVPESWHGLNAALRIGGAHRRTIAFVNGAEVGRHDGFSAPFSFDVTSVLLPGAENDFVLRIENPPFSVTASPPKQVPLYPTGMLDYIANWGGVYEKVSLEAAPQTRIESILVLPDLQSRLVRFEVTLKHTRSAGSLSLRIAVPGAAPVTTAVRGSASVTLDVRIPNAPLWTPEEPNLLTATVMLLANGELVDSVEQRFGLRQIATHGNVLLLNGKPLYLRGYGDDNIEVLGGFPVSSRAVLLERLQRAKSFGFNAVRFHSMVPPETYFEVADEAGMLILAELPAVYTQFFLPHLDFLKHELTDVLTAHRNHPSLLSLAFGNEFNLHWLPSDAERAEFLASVADFYEAAKELAPATLIMSTDGFDMRPTDMVSSPRSHPPDRPSIRHEFGDYYCSLPDTGLIRRFTGAMEPDWLRAKKEWIEGQGLADIYPAYLRNSWKLQQLGRKYQIERVRADARVTGYEYWLIVDFPGGTGEGDSWEEGWFNYFWEPKGIAPPSGSQINSPVLLMIDAGVDERTLWAPGRKHIAVTISNYGKEAIRNGRLLWELLDGETQVISGELAPAHAPLGSVSQAGTLILSVPALNSAKKLELRIKLETGSSRYENRWHFWAYPNEKLPKPSIPVVSTVTLTALEPAFPWVGRERSALTPDSLLICDALDSDASKHLHSGGRVWLMLRQPPHHRATRFFPASGGALGTLIRNHPAMGDFPHEQYCDLQFYNLIDGSLALPIDDWPDKVTPIIGGIRTTSDFLSKSKQLSHVAFAVEGRAMSGKLLITTLALQENLDEAHPAVMALTNSFLRYATSDAFQPKPSIPNRLLEQFGPVG